MSVRRFDTAVRLDGAKRTPQGGLRVDAAISRTGILRYRQPDGSYITEYLPPEELSRQDSIETLGGAPVTKLHPSEMVTKSNWSKYARGTVGESVRVDGDKIVATVYLQDADLADAVERGDMKEVSAGYLCDLVNSPGVVPEGQPDAGQRYDRLQTNRRYNHVAVVPMGRAGAEVALRLDAEDNAIAPSEKNDEGEMEEKIKELQAKLDALQARYDAAMSRLDGFEKADAAAKRTALEASARKVLGAEAKFDGKSDVEIKRAVAAKGAAELKLDGKSDAYVDAAFDLAVSRADEATQALANVNVAAHAAAHTDAADKPVDLDKAREDMVERNRSAWKKPAKA